jgi:hypothetical protein
LEPELPFVAGLEARMTGAAAGGGKFTEMRSAPASTSAEAFLPSTDVAAIWSFFARCSGVSGTGIS